MKTLLSIVFQDKIWLSRNSSNSNAADQNVNFICLSFWSSVNNVCCILFEFCVDTYRSLHQECTLLYNPFQTFNRSVSEFERIPVWYILISSIFTDWWNASFLVKKLTMLEFTSCLISYKRAVGKSVEGQ